ncbi:MAG: 7-cyano-7-deazaguanine synthase QueC [Candidatus Aminicenantes bacterium]|nr:7-cyano-7-deazaguanine synthase QueC [Candidatus Aminicenantes bacterium]
MKEKNAVILFSGGLDSTTALYWAKKNFDKVYALIFDYAQKHNIEVEMAKKTAAKVGVEFQVIDFPLKSIVYSALIDEEKEIPESLAESKNEAGVPFTYVPFRNGIFLALAAAFAESRGIFDLITGFNLIDTPDYPDTTEAFTAKMEAAINQGTSASITGKNFKVHTPLIRKSKKEIIEFGLELQADYSYSVSCYRGQEQPCLKCPSCDIRARAFGQLDMADPLIIRLKKEGKI